jgi:hypothetical protein
VHNTTNVRPAARGSASSPARRRRIHAPANVIAASAPAAVICKVRTVMRQT